MTRIAYWRLHGDLLAWGTWVAATVPAHPRLAVAYAAAAAGAWRDGRLQEARDLARRGVEVGGGPANPAAAAPLEALGDVAMLTGDLAAALEAYRGVAALAAPGDPAGLAIATANLALTLAYAGDDQAARPAAEAALAVAVASANPTAIAMARFAEGEAFADADPARAAGALEEARRRAGEVGNRFVAGTALTAMVALRGRHGPPEEALALFRTRSTTGGPPPTAPCSSPPCATSSSCWPGPAATSPPPLSPPASGRWRRARPTAPRRPGSSTALAAALRRLGDAAYDRAQAAGAARTLEEAADDAYGACSPPGPEGGRTVTRTRWRALLA